MHIVLLVFFLKQLTLNRPQLIRQTLIGSNLQIPGSRLLKPCLQLYFKISQKAIFFGQTLSEPEQFLF